MGRGGVGDPDLSPDQRRWLGLDKDESVRVLSTRGRTVVLERSGCDSAPLPWDRDLVLSADVRAFPIADVLNMINSAAKSGFIFFEDGPHEKAVYIHRGEVVFASSNQVVDRLGECLLRMGVITLEQQRETKKAYRTGGHFGKILVEKGFLTPREVWNGVKSQVEEIVRSLFAYGSGHIMFWEGEVRPDNVVRLSLPTRRLIAEGLRRRDELLKLLAWLESRRARLIPVKGAGDDLTGTERAIYDAARSDTGFADICREIGIDPLSGARTVKHLRLCGALEVGEREPDDPKLEQKEVGSGDRQAVTGCVVNHLQVISELAAPIVAVEGPEGIRLRLERVIEEGARRFPELLSGLDVGPGGAIDPAPVIERALRFPGDREREVTLAFGELMSYLEFELANHPKIDDPEEFLDAIEGMRGRL